MAVSISACAACLRRAVQVAPRGVAFAEVSALLHSYPQRQPTRQYATSSSPAPATGPEPALDAPQSLDVAPLDPTTAQKKAQQKMVRHVKMELPHLDDAWKLAQHVERKLSQDRFDEALLLTQMASKDKQVVVSWNHLINYQLEHQQLKRAIKLYNDMKKRSQLPTLHTFTIIFRGLAKSDHPKLAVAEAMKQYNILINDTRLEPNAIHLNAVLNVCARAGDLDSMFLLADTANESTRAPTSFTYTIIVNALRSYATKDMRDLAPEEQEAVAVKVIKQAKGLWMEVMQKWKQGRLVIDEELVCAMGRILLLEPKREDRRQVFELLEQTMSIPNLLATPNSKLIQDPDMKSIAVAGQSKRVPQSKAVYAVPNRNTLGLVLTVLASTKSTKVGIKYWNLMIRHYGIVPDRDNWLRMLGMLKFAKASAHASTILDYLPDEYVMPVAYRIGMETVVRDNLNIHAMEHANKVLAASIARLPTPDLQTLRLFLRAALVSHYHMRAKAAAGDVAGAKYDYGVQITEALAKLWEPYKQTFYHCFKATKATTKAEQAALYNDKREVIALARLMVSAFNKVINEGMLPEKNLREIRPIGAKINREIQAFYADRENREPSLRKGKDLASEANEMNDDDMPIWGADYRSAGDYIWDTASKKRDDEFEKQKFEERVRRRDEGKSPKRDGGAWNREEVVARKRYERVVNKYDKKHDRGARNTTGRDASKKDEEPIWK